MGLAVNQSEDIFFLAGQFCHSISLRFIPMEMQLPVARKEALTKGAGKSFEVIFALAMLKFNYLGVSLLNLVI